ncbi:MAG: recombinase family protein [Endomicrobium sp.]|nr:recombinase family protein [Endomicrobium sp.]
MVPNVEEAKFIKRIFELFSTGVYTQLAIIDILKKEGLKISKQTLNKHLRRPIYCGLLRDIYNLNHGEYIDG